MTALEVITPELKSVYNLLCLVFVTFDLPALQYIQQYGVKDLIEVSLDDRLDVQVILFCLSWPLQWEALSTVKGQARVQKSVQPPFRLCPHCFVLKESIPLKDCCPLSSLCIMFQVSHALSSTSSSPGQGRRDIPVQYFLKESPKLLLNAEQYSIINKPSSYSQWLPAAPTTIAHYSTHNQDRVGC